MVEILSVIASVITISSAIIAICKFFAHKKTAHKMHK